jgi:UDP-N-acetylmuramoyl-L-alanyl-D-glutamate--2,6-diaminopimelate ligase
MLRTLKNYGHLVQAVVANFVYGFPSKKLNVICVTGTDGKTTTSTLIYHLLKKANKKVALISTVAAYIGEEEIDTGFHVTLPSSFALQKLLQKIASKGMEYVVLEITSHGIDQYRNWGITPELAGITNVTHEHLDYHKTYDTYLQVKASLLTSSKYAFINQDASQSYAKLKNILRGAKTPFDSYSIKRFPQHILQTVKKRFGEERYNYENAALAFAISRKLEIKDEVFKEAIRSFPGVKGRMEEIKNKSGIKVIVDFAHTPFALEQALQAVKSQEMKKGGKGKIIVIFGCAGLRDIRKRPLMGGIASRLADYAIFTAEDPRSEDVWSIIHQMKSGVKTNHNRIMSVADRGEAIEYALTKLAKKGDTVIITGKGHERSMCYGSVEKPWSDQDAVKKILS